MTAPRTKLSSKISFLSKNHFNPTLTILKENGNPGVESQLPGFMETEFFDFDAFSPGYLNELCHPGSVLSGDGHPCLDDQQYSYSNQLEPALAFPDTAPTSDVLPLGEVWSIQPPVSHYNPPCPATVNPRSLEGEVSAVGQFGLGMGYASRVVASGASEDFLQDPKGSTLPGPDPCTIIKAKNTASHQGKKRAAEEGLPGYYCFSLDQHTEPEKRRKKKATVEQRKQTQEVKLRGACLRCKMYKLRVSNSCKV